VEPEATDVTDMAAVSRSKGVFRTRVVGNEPVCREHYRLTLAASEFPEALPGQFVQILCTEPSDEGWTGGAFVRRPFSIGGLRRRPARSLRGKGGLPSCESGPVEIEILHRAIGIGTRWLARLQAGEQVSILGPLGQPFRMPGPDRRTALLVGGGIGLPPLIWLAAALHQAEVTSIAFCGARTADVLPLTRDCAVVCPPDQPAPFCAEFARSNTPGIVATDDGSLGSRGLIPDVFAAYLDRHPEVADSSIVYTCGPDPMMRAVAEVCRARRLPCQVCLERMMACGMGTCQSCVVRTQDSGAPDGWRYRLCCTDGPVFDSEAVIWEG